MQLNKPIFVCGEFYILEQSIAHISRDNNDGSVGHIKPYLHWHLFISFGSRFAVVVWESTQFFTQIPFEFLIYPAIHSQLLFESAWVSPLHGSIQLFIDDEYM